MGSPPHPVREGGQHWFSLLREEGQHWFSALREEGQVRNDDACGRGWSQVLSDSAVGIKVLG